MPSVARPAHETPQHPERTPPLRPGDWLNAPQDEQCYGSISELKKAEIINRVVCLGSPVLFEDHGGPRVDLVT